MSVFGRRPDNLTSCIARSSIFTGSPISKTNMLPFWFFTASSGIAAACRTKDVASFTVMKKRVISGCVIVIGPPAAICLSNSGITEPVEPKTLPNLTDTNLQEVDSS